MLIVTNGSKTELDYFKALRKEPWLSQPSFEVWLILHLRSGCPGFNDATQAGAHLKRLLPHWDKAALRFSDFSAGVLDAADRAKGLGEPPSASPSTAVWRIIESLRAGRAPPDDVLR